MQRTGTTSVGRFFMAMGYKVADWDVSHANQWSTQWYRGDVERVFSSSAFKRNEVFEDDPWFLPDFYRVLYHRFPDARFILFTRDSADWFASMKSHSNGMNPGNTRIHAKVYQREAEVFTRRKTDPSFAASDTAIDNLLSLEGMDMHYRSIYEARNDEIKSFFQSNAPQALFSCDLDDPNKWLKLAAFFGMTLPPNFDVHLNATKKQ
jgi:hypothetical protein